MTLAALPSTTIETVADLLESLGDIPPETAPEKFTVLDESQTLDGGTVLPGLEIPLRELFDRAGRRFGPSE